MSDLYTVQPDGTVIATVQSGWQVECLPVGDLLLRVGSHIERPEEPEPPTYLMDGGYSWEYYQNATSFSTAVELFGLNAIQVCHENKVVAVGEQLVGGSSLVWTLKPNGSTWD